MKVQARNLRLADIVRLSDDNAGYMDATVKQVKDGEVTFFRPYTATADFSSAGGVICYVGIEEFSRPANSEIYELLRRKVLK